MKKYEGITLVALVITIIILLILAGITINSLTGSGLFENTKLAKERSEDAQKLENETLGEYENQILKYIDGSRNENNIKSEALYKSEACVSTPGQIINLAKEVDNYSYILVVISQPSGAKLNSNIFSVSDIQFRADMEHEVASYGTRYVDFAFLEDKKSIKILSSETMGIRSVYGLNI